MTRLGLLSLRVQTARRDYVEARRLPINDGLFRVEVFDVNAIYSPEVLPMNVGSVSRQAIYEGRRIMGLITDDTYSGCNRIGTLVFYVGDGAVDGLEGD